MRGEGARMQLPLVALLSRRGEEGTGEIALSAGDRLVVRQAATADELVDETAFFLHRTVANLSEDRRQMLSQIRQKEPSLQGRKVLIVDDDIRNIFSLTSVLEQYKVEVVYAENGRDGIAILRSMPDIDVGADRHHDAGDGRLPDDARDPPARAPARRAADRGDRQGDEGRPPEVHRRRRLGLCCEAGRHRSAAVAAAGVDRALAGAVQGCQ